MSSLPTIIWTKIDEAPALATYSLLPIVQKFTRAAGINVEARDISLAGRVIATMGEYLAEDQRIADELAYLGQVVKQPEGNIIKLGYDGTVLRYTIVTMHWCLWSSGNELSGTVGARCVLATK